LPFVYLLLSERFPKFVNNPIHLLLTINILFHEDKLIISLITLCTILIVLFTRNVVKLRNLSYNLYLICIVFVVLYNPLFYVGKFDSVVEGFWLGWLQRLVNGEIIYRDFYAYHPPFLTWLLYVFTKLTSFSIFYVRAYFHILYILGLTAIALVADKLIKSGFLKISAVLTIFSLTGGEVKNNIEIRLGLGLLAILLFYLGSIQNTRYRNVFLSGIVSVIALFVSTEVGISVLFAILIYIFFLAKNRLRLLIYFSGGILLVAVPTISYLGANNALLPFLRQVTDYAGAFSYGYFNIPVERPIELAFFYWHIFYEYLSTTAFYWFLVQFSFAGVLILFFYKKFVGKNINPTDKLSFTITIFGFFLSRSTLGRSDYYHLLFVLVLAVLLFFYFVESINLAQKIHSKVLVTAVFLMLFVGNHAKYYLSSIIYKFQTYGDAIGAYQEYETERGGIIFEEDKTLNKERNDLISYVQENVPKDGGIFVFPWMPELYFLTDSKNVTSFDAPYAFIAGGHQEKMIDELKMNKPKFVVYNPNMNFGSLSPDSLPPVHNYILENYQESKRFGQNIILIPK